jgi:hypothetical protein
MEAYYVWGLLVTMAVSLYHLAQWAIEAYRGKQ